MKYGRRTRLRFRRPRVTRGRKRTISRKSKRPLKRRRLSLFRMSKRGKTAASTLGGLLQQTKTVMHKYVNCIQFDSNTTGALDVISGAIVRMNSVYDPLYAATGNFNQWTGGARTLAAIYNHYEVTRSVLYTTFSQAQSTGYPRMMAIGCRLDDDASVLSATNGWEIMTNDPQTNLRLVHCRGAGDGTWTIKTTFVASKFFAGKSNNDWGATSGANPTECCYSIPWMQNGNKTLDGSGRWNITQTLYQWTKYSEPKDYNTLTSIAGGMQS